MNYKKTLLKGGKVLFEKEFIEKDIVIENGKVIKIGENLKLDCETIDCTNKIITPGFVDVHVHLREPGYEYKEDIKSGSLSAIRGGYTTIYAMPNTNPVMDNIETVKLFNKLVTEKAYCNVKTFASVTYGLKGEQITEINKLAKYNIAGYSDDGKGIQDDEIFAKAIKKIKKTNKILSVHSEDMSELEDGYAIDSNIAEKFDCVGINNESESNMVKRDLKYIKKYNAKYHVCHVSTKETANLIRNAQKEGLDVTGEVTAHHLVLCNEDIKSDNGIFKMNPPLRSKVDRYELLKCLNDGTINIIASDHAPHSEEEKNKGLAKSMFGIIGLEQTYSVLNTFLIKSNLISEEKILRAMTYNPAKRFGEEITIKVGNKVNLTIIDPNENYFVDKYKLKSKSTNSMFVDVNLTGNITHTILNDKLYDWSKDEA